MGWSRKSTDKKEVREQTLCLSVEKHLRPGTETTEALSWGVIGRFKNGKQAYVAGTK